MGEDISWLPFTVEAFSMMLLSGEPLAPKKGKTAGDAVLCLDLIVVAVCLFIVVVLGYDDDASVNDFLVKRDLAIIKDVCVFGFFCATFLYMNLLIWAGRVHVV